MAIPATEWWDKVHPITCYISYDQKELAASSDTAISAKGIAC